MHPHNRLAGGLSAIGSMLATITAWQEQLEYWLRVGASLVALIAGLISIYYYIRHRVPPTLAEPDSLSDGGK